MDWKKYYDNFLEITNGDNKVKSIKSKGIDDLTNYKLIGRYNLSDLKIGMHIKYVKNVFDMRTNQTYEKIFNGGFLLNVLNSDKVVDMVLVLKSNIIWKMRFIKYKIYGKDPELFAKTDTNNTIINKIADEFKDDINKKKEEIRNRYAIDTNMIAKKKKNYNIVFQEQILDLRSETNSDISAEDKNKVSNIINNTNTDTDTDTETDEKLMSELNKTFIKPDKSTNIKRRILLTSMNKYKNI